MHFFCKPMKLMFIILISFFMMKKLIKMIILIELFLIIFIFLYMKMNNFMFLFIFIFFISSSTLMFIIIVNSIRSFNKMESNIYLF